jgi:hypothetical protein
MATIDNSYPSSEDQELISLSQNIDSIEDIFNASPFDPLYDINQKLTQTLFYRYFFINANEFKRKCSELQEMIKDIASPARVVFISGFAGNGKTTFIRTFIRDHPEYHNIYIDFQEKRASYPINESEVQDENNSEVIAMLNRATRFGLDDGEIGNKENLIRTFQLIFDLRLELRDKGFISKQCYQKLCQYDVNNPMDEIMISTIMDEFLLKDTFTCFFIHLFLNTKGKNTKVIYFDNLDITAINYLSTVFLEHFQSAISDAVHISRIDIFQKMEIDFKHEYRFVFCLRDASDIEINQHLKGRIGLQRMNFNINFTSQYYKDIFKKRVDVLGKLKFNDRDLGNFDISGFVNTCALFIEDDYFRDVFIPLYNYDFRRISTLLLQAVKKYKLFNEQDSRSLIGILMFEVVDNLMKDNFLGDYFRKPPDLENGYCNIDRVLLTVIINQGEYTRKLVSGNLSNPYEFYYLVKDINLIYKNVDLILESIARCFLYHQLNWVHLITIIGCGLKNNHELIDEYSKQIQLVLEDPTSIANIRIKNKLNEIKIRVNPAGFTYVRSLITHFEFYSCLAENTEPLYVNATAINSVKQDEYLFENKINKTLKVVKIHIQSMKLFYENNYIPNGITPERYPSSIYCFKHHGFGSSERLDKEGYFHSTRVVTSQIDYIDNFRRRIIGDPHH